MFLFFVKDLKEAEEEEEIAGDPTMERLLVVAELKAIQTCGLCYDFLVAGRCLNKDCQFLHQVFISIIVRSKSNLYLSS